MSQVDSDKKNHQRRERNEAFDNVFGIAQSGCYFDRHYRSSFDFYLRSVVIRVFFKSLSLLFITKIPKIS